MKKGLWCCLLMGITLMVHAQSTNIGIGNETYHLMDRMEIKSGNLTGFYTNSKPYDRRDVTKFAIMVDELELLQGKRNQFDLRYLFQDNNDWIGQNWLDEDTPIENYQTDYYENQYLDSSQTFYKPRFKNLIDSSTNSRYYKSRKSWFNLFYKTPANFWELDTKAFKLRVNPILHFKMGQEQSDSSLVFLNTRGFELRGHIDDKVWFYTSLFENQARFPIHVTERNIATNAVQGAGFFKDFNSQIFNIQNGYDYLNAQGYFAARVTKHIHLEFGHGRHFIGDGMRSMFLSDYSNNYFYLQLRTRIWKLNYQNLFAELVTQFDDEFDNLREKKYMAIHHLSINVLKNLRVGLFEAVVFDRSNTFELQYLNPIILYRTVEQGVGSPDNAFLGFDIKYNFAKHFSAYGQLLFDEFRFSEFIIERRGWWANKYGFQLGLKYIDAFGIDHLDIQAEYNTARPYTYTHDDSTANYTHYNQPLAHPLGANFREILLQARYVPAPRVTLLGRVIFADYGTNGPGENWGGDIFEGNRMRSAPDGIDTNFGHETGQGVGNQLLALHFTGSYQFRHNLYFDIDAWFRDFDSDNDALDYNRIYVGFGVRLNITDRVIDY
ncbi:MAG: hypothetical protein AAF598_17815 [Bacteroidota bacterium]